VKFKTLAIHASQKPDPAYGAVMTPIYQTSTFEFRGVNQPGPFDYSRSGNPTRKALEDCIAALEGGKYGFAFATGMAAESTLLTLYNPGDHLIVHNDLYGGTYRVLVEIIARKGIGVEFIDLRDPAAIRAAIKPQTKAIWIETPTNPLMNLIDLEAVSRIAREHRITTICDNTFLSPFFQRPLEFGVDIVVHSTTKYVNGHSDVVGGAIVTGDSGLGEKITYLQNALGTCAGPQDCFLVLRGLKTLAIRMEEHNRNALAIARWLQKHPKTIEVFHPGLETHPQRELASRQMKGFGGTFSFRVRGGQEGAFSLLRKLRLFTLAESLGGVESLIDHPATMTHVSIPADVRGAMGITDDLIRVSVGLEDVEDLIADLESAMA